VAFFSLEHIKIVGIAACVPKKVIRTADYTEISEQERKLFVQGTGILERRESNNGLCTSDMCFASAEKLLAETNTKKEDIDILIFVSQSPDYFLPCTSILLQNRLGLKKSTLAFDITLGCSGYVYGLATIGNYLQLPHFKKALLLCGDTSTFSTGPGDKSTYPLFGDAGTATLLERNANTASMYFNLQSDGSGAESIIIRGGGARNRFKEGMLDKKQVEPGIARAFCDLELNGVEVFNFALREVKPNVIDLLAFANKNIEDIDYLVMHQANKLMNESVRKKLKFPPEKTPYSIDKYGNTSSASIPLTMVTELGDVLRKEAKQILLSGFGVGYSWGSVLMETDNLVISDLIEIE
jgi:3-oxoacyl-[acyl-carrier-protein] synthase-3